MRLIFNNATLVDASGERRGSQITINGTKIISVDPAREIGENAVDADGAIITPGFIDIHTHGGGGFSLHTSDPTEIRAYARWAPSTGTTSFLIGVVGVSGGLPEEQLEAAVAAFELGRHGAEPLGIHLEGPYISRARCGAHHPAWLRTPAPAETSRLLELAGERLRLVTLAPELPGAEGMICTLVEAGVRVSIGHTEASYAQTKAAIKLGASHAAHCLNAMPAYDRRNPGPLGALLEAQQVSGELIVDGVHLDAGQLRALIGALGPRRAIAVTDALPCAGCQDASFSFAGRKTMVQDGAARLNDGSLAGSILTTAGALRNLVELADLPLSQAVAMLSHNPAQVAGVAERKGLLTPGYDADLLIFDQQLQLQASFCRGTLSHVTGEWRRRLRL